MVRSMDGRCNDKSRDPVIPFSEILMLEWWKPDEIKTNIPKITIEESEISNKIMAMGLKPLDNKTAPKWKRIDVVRSKN